jgi:2-amino-4-hydroxy-6-hydroxymethyldihydropteridine diphosphokinase
LKKKTYLLLGGNLGDRKQNLEDALRLIEENAGKILSLSRIYETEPWGFSDQPAFYNQAVLIETHLKPEILLNNILEIEKQLGRIRYVKWHERLIDIDIVFYEDEIIDLPGLKIPHPHLQERKFALAPLTDIAADFAHPVLNKTVKRLMEECDDELDVKVVIGD